MGLSTSSCMSSSAITSAVFAPVIKKKKQRESFPFTSATPQSDDCKQSICKIQRKKDRSVSSNMSALKIDTTQFEDIHKMDYGIRLVPEENDQYSSLDSKKFIESNDRDTVVAYSYMQGINMQYTLHDDPTYFIGWEVHIEGEGVGFILSCLGPLFSGVRFEVQDGRILVVPFSQGCGVVENNEEMKITFLQRIF